MERKVAALYRMSDRGNDSFVPGTPAERISLVWPLTREIVSLSKRYDAERRLQRDVTRIVRREGLLGCRKAKTMTAIPSDEAGKDLSSLIEQVSLSHEPVQILSEEGTAVLVAEEDWRSIQETLYLVSMPGMRESIREGMAAPVEECSEDPGW
jgi:PHD/YefM family antitoxin component YafN of YafNO toxin-antitoxin module